MQTFSITEAADAARIEARPYAECMRHASVFDGLSEAAHRHGDRPALTFITSADPDAPARQWTHREFLAEVRRAANLFHALVAPDQPRVAMLLPAIPAAYFTLWGAETAGLVCPINYLLNAEHVAELIRACKANILVALGPNAELD